MQRDARIVEGDRRPDEAMNRARVVAEPRIDRDPEGRCEALQAPRGANARHVAHEELEVACAGVNEDAFEDVAVHSAYARRLIEMWKEPFEPLAPPAASASLAHRE